MKIMTALNNAATGDSPSSHTLVSSGIGGAATVLVVWIAGQFKIDVPQDVAIAAVVVLSYLSSLVTVKAST